jgi:hypothetical protein
MLATAWLKQRHHADLGIPFSQDMGSSYWFDCMGAPNPQGTFHCKPAPSDPYQPVPVPLLANYTPIAQPAGLFTIAKRYAAVKSFRSPPTNGSTLPRKHQW